MMCQNQHLGIWHHTKGSLRSEAFSFPAQAPSPVPLTVMASWGAHCPRLRALLGQMLIYENKTAFPKSSWIHCARSAHGPSMRGTCSSKGEQPFCLTTQRGSVRRLLDDFKRGTCWGRNSFLVLRFTGGWVGSSDSGVIREPRLMADPWLPAVLQARRLPQSWITGSQEEW